MICSFILKQFYSHIHLTPPFPVLLDGMSFAHSKHALQVPQTSDDLIILQPVPAEQLHTVTHRIMVYFLCHLALIKALHEFLKPYTWPISRELQFRVARA